VLLEKILNNYKHRIFSRFAQEEEEEGNQEQEQEGAEDASEEENREHKSRRLETNSNDKNETKSTHHQESNQNDDLIHEVLDTLLDAELAEEALCTLLYNLDDSTFFRVCQVATTQQHYVPLFQQFILNLTPITAEIFTNKFENQEKNEKEAEEEVLSLSEKVFGIFGERKKEIIQSLLAKKEQFAEEVFREMCRDLGFVAPY
jgi:hypothetical protein